MRRNRRGCRTRTLPRRVHVGRRPLAGRTDPGDERTNFLGGGETAADAVHPSRTPCTRSSSAARTRASRSLRRLVARFAHELGQGIVGRHLGDRSRQAQRRTISRATTAPRAPHQEREDHRAEHDPKTTGACEIPVGPWPSYTSLKKGYPADESGQDGGLPAGAEILDFGFRISDSTTQNRPV